MSVENYKCIIVPNVKTYTVTSSKWAVEIVDGVLKVCHPPRIPAPKKRRRLPSKKA